MLNRLAWAQETFSAKTVFAKFFAANFAKALRDAEGIAKRIADGADTGAERGCLIDKRRRAQLADAVKSAFKTDRRETKEQAKNAYMSLRKIAKETGLSISRLTMACALHLIDEKRGLPFVQIGIARYVKPSDVGAWLDNLSEEEARRTVAEIHEERTKAQGVGQ